MSDNIHKITSEPSPETYTVEVCYADGTHKTVEVPYVEIKTMSREDALKQGYTFFYDPSVKGKTQSDWTIDLSKELK